MNQSETTCSSSPLLDNPEAEQIQTPSSGSELDRWYQDIAESAFQLGLVGVLFLLGQVAIRVALSLSRWLSGSVVRLLGLRRAVGARRRLRAFLSRSYERLLRLDRRLGHRIFSNNPALRARLLARMQGGFGLVGRRRVRFAGMDGELYFLRRRGGGGDTDVVTCVNPCNQLTRVLENRDAQSILLENSDLTEQQLGRIVDDIRNASDANNYDEVVRLVESELNPRIDNPQIREELSRVLADDLFVPPVRAGATWTGTGRRNSGHGRYDHPAGNDAYIRFSWDSTNGDADGPLELTIDF